MGKKPSLADGDKALRSKQLLRNDASEGAEFTDNGYASLLKGRDLVPVSYTHLDVYKRQGHERP